MKTNKINVKTISDQIYNHLLYQIISKQRPPKEKLSEAKLAKEFGISRVPVREALVRLTKEGLVKSIPRYGKYVNELTVKDVKEIFELRQVLEPMALRLGIARIDLKKIHQVRDMLDKSDTLSQTQRRDLMLKADAKLHYLIRHSAGNKHLEEMLQKFDNLAGPLRAFDSVESTRMDELARERKEIVDAIIRQNCSEAEELLRIHIKKGEDSIIKKMSA